jgi:hypothetical protein
LLVGGGVARVAEDMGGGRPTGEAEGGRRKERRRRSLRLGLGRVFHRVMMRAPARPLLLLEGGGGSCWRRRRWLGTREEAGDLRGGAWPQELRLLQMNGK